MLQLLWGWLGASPFMIFSLSVAGTILCHLQFLTYRGRAENIEMPIKSNDTQVVRLKACKGLAKLGLAWHFGAFLVSTGTIFEFFLPARLGHDLIRGQGSCKRDGCIT